MEAESPMQASPEPNVTPAGACALCGGRAHRSVFPGALPWVVDCEGCGLRRSEPQPTDDELHAIYNEHYYEQFGFVEGEHSHDQGLARTKRATYASLLSVARPHFGLSGGGLSGARRPRLLDVGCGLGFSLFAARDAGFDAVGLDPLAPTDPKARPERTILRGSIETFQNPGEPFDVVSMVDVIEHVRDPVATLRAVERLLAPRGLVIVATNDCSSRGAEVLGPRWVHYHRAHLFFFTKDTLARTAEKAGLDVIAVEQAHRVYNLEYVASILARGTNFELAARVSKGLLGAVPGPLLRAAWPKVPEGIVLVARSPRTR
jgi:2-polyprenyl-3-methyl-5-hydroxy-6-metoxy-1,4-benzoquinol methylase